MPGFHAPSTRPHPAVSNLTKNLILSGQKPNNQEHSMYMHTEGSFPAQASSPHNNFVPIGSPGTQNRYEGFLPHPHTQHSQQIQHGSHQPPQLVQQFPNLHTLQPFGQQLGSFSNQFTPNSQSNYLPIGHNTPTAVSTSYTSNYSYTPSYQLAQQEHGFPSSFKNPAPATTTVLMDLANMTSHQPSQSVHQGFQIRQDPLLQDQIQPHLLPARFGVRPQPPQLLRLPSDRLITSGGSQHQQQAQQAQQVQQPQQLQQQPLEQDPKPLQQSQQQEQQSAYVNPEPDHYMTYHEFFDLLHKQDSGVEDGYDEHINIVDFPVNELITMLACLLTKIIEANDRLHPNHFDNTIAIRQRLKEEKKQKRLQRERQKIDSRESYSGGGISTTIEHLADGENLETVSLDDEEDELKNRYLANVLAFHGTNVPGILLHAYLTRVLKYCPVTNEVFLSLLVYFDRIAKKANNLNSKRRKSDGTATEPDDPEQLFVMDSYNIHRLIISGITVSSKFFSDIFYKNLRYAKVGGLPLEELNYLELQFLLLLDFKLMISVQEIQTYGDLLLKFWKREQLATKLMSPEKPSEPAA